MSDPKTPIEPGLIYHLYNQAVSNDKLFREQRNYSFFFDKFEKWILPVCDPFAWCLMPNHFHFVVRIKEPEELERLFFQPCEGEPPSQGFDLPRRGSQTPSGLVEKISQQFSHCFNSYAQAYNKTYKRKGSLFKESFQRRLIDSDEYLRTAISYVHFNPVKDGFVRLPQEWKHSSFREFLEDQKKPTRKISSALLKEEVLELFGSLREMVEYSPLAYDFDKEQPRRGL